MGRKKKTSSRELGLEVAAICGRHFLKLEDLHYGYWPEDLEVNISNLHKAQQNYTDFLVSHIPSGVKSILDVGCGSGHVARRLLDMGYSVDGVSPSPLLSARARELLGDGSFIFECIFEQLSTDRRYDLVLFSESFQYVNLQQGLEKAAALLNEQGYLLICDVFRSDVSGNTRLGGGHKLARFYERIPRFPFTLVEQVDITDRTAPNMDILDDALTQVAEPVLESSMRFLDGRYPLMTKFLRWKYRKRTEKLYEKYFRGGRRSEDFKKHKTYQLLVYEKGPSVKQGTGLD